MRDADGLDVVEEKNMRVLPFQKGQRVRVTSGDHVDCLGRVIHCVDFRTFRVKLFRCGNGSWASKALFFSDLIIELASDSLEAASMEVLYGRDPQSSSSSRPSGDISNARETGAGAQPEQSSSSSAERPLSEQPEPPMLAQALSSIVDSLKEINPSSSSSESPAPEQLEPCASAAVQPSPGPDDVQLLQAFSRSLKETTQEISHCDVCGLDQALSSIVDSLKEINPSSSSSESPAPEQLEPSASAAVQPSPGPDDVQLLQALSRSLKETTQEIFHCDVCGLDFVDPVAVAIHMDGEEHAKALNRKRHSGTPHESEPSPWVRTVIQESNSDDDSRVADTPSRCDSGITEPTLSRIAVSRSSLQMSSLENSDGVTIKSRVLLSTPRFLASQAVDLGILVAADTFLSRPGVRQRLVGIVRELTELDRFSLAVFGASELVFVPLTYTTAENRAQLESDIMMLLGKCGGPARARFAPKHVLDSLVRCFNAHLRSPKHEDAIAIRRQILVIGNSSPEMQLQDVLSSIYDPLSNFSTDFLSPSTLELQDYSDEEFVNDYIFQNQNIKGRGAGLAMEKVRLEIEVVGLPFAVSASVHNLRLPIDRTSMPREAALMEQQSQSLQSGGIYVDLPCGFGHGLTVPIQFEVSVSLGDLFRAQFDKVALESDVCLVCHDPDIVNNFTCLRNSCKFSICDACHKEKALDRWNRTSPSPAAAAAAPTRCPHCNLESEVTKIGLEKGDCVQVLPSKSSSGGPISFGILIKKSWESHSPHWFVNVDGCSEKHKESSLRQCSLSLVREYVVLRIKFQVSHSYRKFC